MPTAHSIQSIDFLTAFSESVLHTRSFCRFIWRASHYSAG